MVGGAGWKQKVVDRFGAGSRADGGGSGLTMRCTNLFQDGETFVLSTLNKQQGTLWALSACGLLLPSLCLSPSMGSLSHSESLPREVQPQRLLFPIVGVTAGRAFVTS